MAYKSLMQFVEELEKNNLLIRVTIPVSTELEITEIADRISKQPGGGKAILFENNGTDFPLLINALGSDNAMKLALNVSNYDDITDEIQQMFKTIAGPKNSFLEKIKTLPVLSGIAAWLPKVKSGKGVCQEVVHENPDLNILPVLKCWPYDGGKFITFPMVNTKDPHTGIRNVGMYRMQILSKNETGMHWHRHKVGARHYEEYKKLGKKMPVAVALGGDPIYTYSATAPLPDNLDEYLLAGFLRKKKVELVKCITQDIEVPADADIIIEGYVDPAEELIWEGPFGDHTGFYSLADWYPKFHVTCITHRRNAVYPTTIVGVPPQEDAYIAKATERIFLAPIKIAMLPELIDMDIPVAGVAHNLTIVKIHKTFPGQAQKVMSALWGAGQMMFNKILIVTDANVDVHNYEQVAQAIATNVNPETDIHFMRGPLDVLDHASTKFAYGSKLGIDATVKFPEEQTDTILQSKKEIIDKNELLNKYNQITDANLSFFENAFPLVLLAVKVNTTDELNNLAKKLVNETLMANARFVVFVDSTVPVQLIATAFWIFANNIEPMRDSFVLKPENKTSAAKIIIDGTGKERPEEQFARDWPNLVLMNDETIEKVNQNWAKYGLGKFIESPSNMLKSHVSGHGAVFKFE